MLELSSAVAAQANGRRGVSIVRLLKIAIHLAAVLASRLGKRKGINRDIQDEQDFRIKSKNQNLLAEWTG